VAALTTRIIKLKLSVPPSANEYFHVTAKGGRYPTPEAKAYRAAVAMLSTLRFRGIAQPWFPEGDVALSMYWSRKNLAAGDLDNRLKILLDALQGVAYTNDRQVARIVAERGDPAEHLPEWPEGYIDLVVEEFRAL